MIDVSKHISLVRLLDLMVSDLIPLTGMVYPSRIYSESPSKVIASNGECDGLREQPRAVEQRPQDKPPIVGSFDAR
jgi:hypothetical protein